MPLLTDFFYEKTKTNKTNHYIETGTYMGNGIKSVLNDYNFVHSIELSKEWYDYNIEQFSNNNKVKIYHGDSKKLLPEVLKNIKEPVTIFLDAHYSGGNTAYGEEEVPLLKELQILRNRDYDDIIIIDDCRLLGRKGINNKTMFYPEIEYNWENITEDEIINTMKPNYGLLKNTNNEYLTAYKNDQYILVPLK
jgi:hypothetical protein